MWGAPHRAVDPAARHREQRCRAVHGSGTGVCRVSRLGKWSRSISRVLSWTIIHLRQVSPLACSDLPESTVGHSIWIPIWSCSGWGLPSPRLLPAARCALTAPFHPYPTVQRGQTPYCGSQKRALTLFFRRCPFCCTFRRLAPPRCYLAPCPVEPGLSSLRQPAGGSRRAIA